MGCENSIEDDDGAFVVYNNLRPQPLHITPKTGMLKITIQKLVFNTDIGIQQGSLELTI